MLVYTPEEVANELKISRRTVYNLLRRGDLDALRVGSLFRITEAQLQQYLSRTTERRTRTQEAK